MHSGPGMISVPGAGLLARYRRYWFVIGLCLLAVPMMAQLAELREVVSEDEGRMLSPAPAWPRSPDQWRALPRDLDRFLADHFGLRPQLVRAHGALRYAIVLPTDLRVIIGRDRWLFLNGDGTIEQATGRLLREPAIAKFADRAAELQKRLKARNARLLVAIPPNGSTINRSRLPAWAATKPAVTEYDLMMKALAARDVAAVDLRPALLAINSIHPVYRRTDTHWNRLGALVAYNSVVEVLGEADWTIDPGRVLRGFESVPGGDLARLLAVSDSVTDEDAVIDLSRYRPAALEISRIDTQAESGGDLIETGRAGPTVLVIGDSFTREFWQDYFSLHAGKYIWIHHELCGFAASVVESHAPDIVILAPAERQMFCFGQ
jgi:alginate O-acetyltransferase complex protein AlgJ